MKITNPKVGARVEVNGLVLEVGETKDFLPADAEYLLKTFGFLEVVAAKKVVAPKLGGAKKKSK